MAVQLISFLLGLSALILPGIWLAKTLALGNNRVERWTYGSNLGLALATYLASATSHIDLRIFYPLWAAVAVISLVRCLKSRAPKTTDNRTLNSILTLLILLAVAFTRFAVALPQQLPHGELDPTFHLLLARKIQLTHHAINDWQPFADVTLNYPTGSHTLLVILAAFSRLPLEDVFRLLLPTLGVLSTAQIYVLARRVMSSDAGALCAAAIYGLWAWYGSLDYFRWGGLPNELAMLFFIAALSIWLDPLPAKKSIGLMAIFLAAMVLVHHHLMLVAGAIVLGILAWEALRKVFGLRAKNPHQATTPDEPAAARRLILASLLAAILISFFLIPYAAKAADLGNTGIAHTGEPPIDLLTLPSEIGRALFALSILGIALWLARRIRLHSLVAVSLITLGAMFLICEYAVPAAQAMLGKPSFTAFTPSRFLTDMNYFLPIVAAAALVYLKGTFKLPWIGVTMVILLATLLDYTNWQRLSETPLPPGFIEACHWIRDNTSPDTIVDDARDQSGRPLTNWNSYLTWRRTNIPPLPISEPWALIKPMARQIPLILSGQQKPDSPEMKIVRIIDPRAYTGEPVLWQSQKGLLVIQEWPPTNAAPDASTTQSEPTTHAN
jgi:hypothetical protein